ncbi:MAG: hypothetical protein PHS82_01850 [Lachnospiraceae bacterium]|nr:hypothetical protein [Lachnospiraceae bacterium]
MMQGSSSPAQMNIPVSNSHYNTGESHIDQYFIIGISIQRAIDTLMNGTKDILIAGVHCPKYYEFNAQYQNFH